MAILGLASSLLCSLWLFCFLIEEGEKTQNLNVEKDAIPPVIEEIGSEMALTGTGLGMLETMRNQTKGQNQDHYVHTVSRGFYGGVRRNLDVTEQVLPKQGMQGENVGSDKGQITLDGEQAFARVSAKLKAHIGTDAYASWFGRLKLVDYSLHQVRLSVPTAFLRSWISNHYFSLLTALWREENPEILRVEITVRSVRRSGAGQGDSANFLPSTQTDASKREERVKGGDATVQNQPLMGQSKGGTKGTERDPQRKGEMWEGDTGNSLSMRMAFGSPLDTRYSFDSFVEGAANRVALAAARSIAEAGTGALRFNPLFIHASVGLGKTHLLQAIAAASIARTSLADSKLVRTVYLTAEYFMWRFASAIRDNSTLAFKEQLRAIDLLIIDDMQFLQGKSIQNEFCHLLNSLLDSARQIVVAADRPPTELESLDVRVRSRLSCGVALEMGAPDYAMRLEILRRRYKAVQQENPAVQIRDEVLSYIAQTISGSGRDLEGAFNQVLFRHSFEPDISPSRIDDILEHLTRAGEARRIRIEDIQRFVARHYNISKQDMLSNRRTRAIVGPRQVAMYLSKKLTARSLPEIGRSFGGRDHTTVLHAVRTIEGKMGTDQKLTQELELLKRLINERP